MAHFEHPRTRHAAARAAVVVTLAVLASILLLPASSAQAQHHGGGHHGGHFGHASSRYSFGARHRGHGFNSGLHRGGHRSGFGHFGGHRRHGLHHGHTRLHGRSHRAGRLHGTRGFRSGLRHADHSGYRTGRNDCEPVYKRAEVDGRPATLEGLRCYDSHGDAYIEPESRTIVEYHDVEDHDDGYRQR